MSGFDDLINIKDEYENVEIPQELDGVIDYAIKRAKKKKRLGFIKPVSIAAAFILAFITTVNVSPAFAGYVSRVPGLSELVKLVSFDKGLVDAVDNGFGMDLNLSVEDKGIKFTVLGVVMDGKKMTIPYTLDNGKENYLNLGNLSILGSNNEKLESIGINSSPGEVTVTQGVISAQWESPITEIPEFFTVKVGSISAQDIGGKGSKDIVIEGNWDLSIPMKGIDVSPEPQILSIGKTLTHEKFDILIKDIIFYPTLTELRLKVKEPKGFKMEGLEQVDLLDDNGITYKGTGSRWSIEADPEITLQFESAYFNEFKSLSIKCDGIYFRPDEELWVEVDLVNKKVIQDAGLGAEFYDKEPEISDEKPEKGYNLRLISKEQKNNLGQSFAPAINFEDKATDENGMTYDIKGTYSEMSPLHKITGEVSTGSKCEEIIQNLNIDIKDEIPSKLKIKIITVQHMILPNHFI